MNNATPFSWPYLPLKLYQNRPYLATTDKMPWRRTWRGGWSLTMAARMRRGDAGFGVIQPVDFHSLARAEIFAQQEQ